MANPKKKLCVNPAWCKGCKICVSFCPTGTLELVNQKISIAHPDKCILCGQCEMRCPDYAIYLEDIKEEGGR